MTIDSEHQEVAREIVLPTLTVRAKELIECRIACALPEEAAERARARERKKASK